MNLIPRAITSKVLAWLFEKVKEQKRKADKAMPKTLLEAKHIQNLKAVSSRLDLLSLLPHEGIVGEIGVDKGNFSSQIIEVAKPRKIHLIDSWSSERYGETIRRSVESRFSSLIQQHCLEINRGLSTDVVHKFPDEYFDWVYIDTNHTYATTKHELELYSQKVKKNGFITGHDFIFGSKNGFTRYGVIEAVYEFCVSFDWEIVYLTMELNDNPSFAIKRIKE